MKFKKKGIDFNVNRVKYWVRAFPTLRKYLSFSYWQIYEYILDLKLQKFPLTAPIFNFCHYFGN